MNLPVDNSRLEAVLARSRSGDGLTRVNAIPELGDFMDDVRARDRLTELLDDEIVTMEVDAAEVLARKGGATGILAVLEVLGRRRDDPDADYMAYRLNELDAGGEVPVVEIVESSGRELSDNAAMALRNLKALRHSPR
ncbi:hypothetical protein [Nocardia bovistercoris]|uniref:Uncharacterized protein n=1 Tax=Nocardia bovistercoris TaxID=2785916 RepID=A0A931N2L0_9NOCA|nr:hypothetical protein [Nocardia bovistercoris]MBH0777019.1 hypothetical protein [Nocardia bovistercoris]